MKILFLVSFVVLHLLDLAKLVMVALKKNVTYSIHQKNVPNANSQVKIYFTANKVSESCGSSNFTKSTNLAEPTSPTVQKQLFSKPVLQSAVTNCILTVSDDHLSNRTSNHSFCPPNEKRICLKRPLQTFTQQRNDRRCIKVNVFPIIFTLLLLYNSKFRLHSNVCKNQQLTCNIPRPSY